MSLIRASVWRCSLASRNGSHDLEVAQSHPRNGAGAYTDMLDAPKPPGIRSSVVRNCGSRSFFRFGLRKP